MKRVEQVSSGKNYTAVEVGRMSELGGHTLTLGPGMEIKGKVFLGEALGTTGGEISFQRFEPGSETGFLHTHRNHEELYVFVSGQGEFQVDGQVFPVGEGTVVRVAQAGRRSVRNNGTEPLVMICVQYRADTFTPQDAQDADLLKDRVSWS